MKLRYLTRFMLVLFLVMGVSLTASAQYGGGGTGTMSSTTYSSGSGYGHGTAIAIGVGAAAAVVGIALYVHHKHSVKENQASISGCTQVSNQRASLIDDKDKRIYSLANTGDGLKAGERVKLAGYLSTDGSGARVFTVQSLVNDWGSCPSQAFAQPEPTASSGQGGQR